jgi:hypothetical protein
MSVGVIGSGVDAVDVPKERVEWEHVDIALRTIAKRRGVLDALEAKWLREAIRVKIWREVGCPTLADYLERRLGYAPRTAHERVRVATALAELPAIERALAAGFPHSAVRELTRVATPETEQKWLDACRDKSVHEIEREVAGRARGSLPGDPVQPDLVGRTLPFEGIRPATIALIRDARRKLQGEHGNAEPLSDDELLASFARSVLESNGSERTSAPYQIAVTVCEQCAGGWMTSGGRKYALSRADVERAGCDAQRIGSLDSDTPGRATQDVSPSTRRKVKRRDGGRCRIPGCRSTRCLELHHIVARTSGGSHDAENLILLCDACHAALHRGLISIRGTSSNLVVERLRPVAYDMDFDICSSRDVEACAHVGTNESYRSPARVTGDVGEQVCSERSDETVPDGTVANETVPDETVPDETVPDETVPDETVPDETVPDETVPDETVPEAVSTIVDRDDQMPRSATRAGVSAEDSSTPIERSAHVGTNAAQANDRADDEPPPRVLSKLEREQLRAEARQALVSLGFRRADAGRAVDLALTRVASPLSLEAVIREALRSCAGT